MAVEVTETWSQVEYDGSTAKKVFQVIGTTNEVIAKNAAGIPVFKQRHDKDGNLFAGISSIKSIGFSVWEVTVPYGLPGFSSSTPDKRNRYRWEYFETNEPVDTDIDGNPILNSGREPVENATDEFVGYRLTVRQFEPFYNLGRALDLSNSVNGGGFTVGNVSVPQGASRLMGIVPESDYTLPSPELPILYTFEFLLARNGQAVDQDAWKLRFLDQGFRQCWDLNGDTEFRVIVDPKTRLEYVKPVRLDGKGAIFDKTNPQGWGTGKGTPKGAELEKREEGVFLKYKMKKERDHGALAL